MTTPSSAAALLSAHPLHVEQKNRIMNEHTTDDVFGINRELPLNYVTRIDADDALIENLPRGKHLVVYGSSKQGKTSLRKHCLGGDDYIIVHCSNKWTVSDVNEKIGL
jgi:ABC-type uncharacterized transport system fused permease/ATPase subunit